MSQHADWSYAQARLQARHGARLDEDDWRALEAARSLDHFIEQSRATSLRRFTDHLDARMSSHEIERILRAAWRSYVVEVATWSAPAWNEAILWVKYVPDLPVLNRLLAGDTPAWARDDPVYAVFANAKPEGPGSGREPSPLFQLLAGDKTGDRLVTHWLVHWRSLWPRGRELDRKWADTLADVVKDHAARLARAGPVEASGTYRRELARTLTRIFRRRSGTPVAAVCHLALIALDLERLRGGLVRRRLFSADPTEMAA